MITYIKLESAVGDAPGYIRQALSELQKLSATPIRNSNLHWAGASMRNGRVPRYAVIAAIETGFRDSKFVEELAKVKSRRRRLKSAVSFSILPSPGSGLTALSEDRSLRQARDTAYLTPPLRLDYDAAAGPGVAYDELRPINDFTRAIFDRAVNSIKLNAKKRVLDVGCGTGRFTRLLASKAREVVGFDASRTMLAAARSAASTEPDGGRRIRFVRGDANRALPKGPFDAVTFFFSLQYMSLKPAFWNALALTLRSSGVVAFATFPHRHFIESELTKYFPSIPRIDLPRFPSVPALEELMDENGFTRIRSADVVSSQILDGDALIERVERKHLSSFHLMTDLEYRRGLNALRKAVQGKTITTTNRAVVVSGHRI